MVISRKKDPLADGHVMRGYCLAVVDMLIDLDTPDDQALSLLRDRNIQIDDLKEIDLNDFDCGRLTALFRGEEFDSENYP